MSELSPFAVENILDSCLGADYRAKQLYSGHRLDAVNSKQQNLALLTLNAIADVKVTVSPHHTLNTVRGVISDDGLLDTSEEQILEGLVHLQ